MKQSTLWRKRRGTGNAPYDYVVVGAGSAGCVLAARLSQCGRHRVALVEAGGEDASFWIHAPLGFGKLYDDPRYNWRYEGEPEPELGGARPYLPRGKVLGGTGSINGMIHSPPHRADFDHWRDLGNHGWGYDDVRSYFDRAADCSFEAASRASGGSLHVERMPPHPLADAFIEAGAHAGFGRHEVADGESEDGFAYNDVAIRNGRRCSSATAYLRPARRRANLAVILHATARRIVFAGRRAAGVEYVCDGRVHAIEARREVIVTAGTYGSPALLQRSGIGDAAFLRERGIDMVSALPGVGENLHDHFAFWGAYRCTRPITVNDTVNEPLRRVAMVLRYVLFRTGTMARNASYASGCIRTEPSLATPDVRLTLLLWCRSTTGRSGDSFGLHPFSSFTVIAALLHPESRGTVRVRDPDPDCPPEIRFNFLTAETDRATAVRALRSIRMLASAPSMAPYVAAEIQPGVDCRDDAAFEAYIRKAGRSNHHPVGTCKMGRDPAAVVDTRLRVHGVGGLRVADASIMPRIVAGNPNSAVIMIAEKAAAMILEDACGS